MEEKTDLRIIKTKKSIYDALSELMYEKTFEEIKVSEICEKALVNRSTFYAHFEDKYDLLNSLINDLNQEFSNALETKESFPTLEKYYERQLYIVVDYIDKNREIYHKMLNKNRNSVAMDMIYDTIKSTFENRIKELYTGEIPVEIITTYLIGGIFNVILMWLQNPSYTKAEILSYLKSLIFKDSLFQNK